MKKPTSLSALKRKNASLRLAIKHQQKICNEHAIQLGLINTLQDLVDFNAGRIDGNPEDFLPSKKDAYLDQTVKNGKAYLEQKFKDDMYDSFDP